GLGGGVLLGLCLRLGPPSVGAQPSMGTGQFRCPNIRQGTTNLGEACILDFDANDFACTRTGAKVTCKTGPAVPEAGGCIGDLATDFCTTVTLPGRNVDGSGALQDRLPVHGAGACTPTLSGDVCWDPANKKLCLGTGAATACVVLQ